MKNFFAMFVKFLEEPINLFIIISVLIFLLIIFINMDIKNFFISASGAFFGAGSAFMFNVYENKKRRYLKNKAELIRTEFAIDKIIFNTKELQNHIIKNQNISAPNFLIGRK